MLAPLWQRQVGTNGSPRHLGAIVPRFCLTPTPLVQRLSRFTPLMVELCRPRINRTLLMVTFCTILKTHVMCELQSKVKFQFISSSNIHEVDHNNLIECCLGWILERAAYWLIWGGVGYFSKADSQWNPVYNVFHRKFCCGNETIRRYFL